jgi:hypothetical protein
MSVGANKLPVFSMKAVFLELSVIFYFQFFYLDSLLEANKKIVVVEQMEEKNNSDLK